VAGTGEVRETGIKSSLRQIKHGSGRQLGQHVEHVAHDAVVGGFEERCFGVFVDNHNYLAGVDARQVLNGARNAAGNVQIGRYRDARLAHVFVVRAPIDVRHRLRAGRGRAQRLGQVFDEVPVFGALHAAAATPGPASPLAWARRQSRRRRAAPKRRLLRPFYRLRAGLRWNSF
nr:hypothetical protein [Tanacetum cinerariifolium]